LITRQLELFISSRPLSFRSIVLVQTPPKNYETKHICKQAKAVSLRRVTYSNHNSKLLSVLSTMTSTLVELNLSHSSSQFLTKPNGNSNSLVPTIYISNATLRYFSLACVCSKEIILIVNEAYIKAYNYKQEISCILCYRELSNQNVHLC